MLAALYSLADGWHVLTDPTSKFVLLITIFVLLAALYSFYDGSKKRPPGPWGLPIVGYLPFMGKAVHIKFAELIPKYGPIMRVKLGSMDCVVLGSFEAVKEAFVKQNERFSGRPEYISFKVYDDEEAFIYKHGEEWKDLRTFSVSILRELGFGRQNLEPVVESEIQFFIKSLEDESLKHSTGFPVGALVEKSIGNAFCSLLLGYRCDYNDRWLDRLVEIIDEIQTTYVTDFVFFFPWMLKVPFLSKFIVDPKKRILKAELWTIWKKKIDECKKAGTMNGVNFLRSWIEEYQKLVDKNDPKAQRFAERSLLSNVEILCQASFETTSTTLQWAFVFLLEDPELQTKIQYEIDEVIGQERLPKYSDAKDMPFTKAFIAETHRKGSIAPFGIYHMNLEEAYLMGHWIPKGTIVIANLYAVHHDPKFFPNPECFDVSRFLNADGKYVKHESLMPFSAGKRFCPGEFVAEMELFLYLVSLLQKYTLKAPSALNFGSVPKNTLINRPNPFNMCIKRR